MSQIEKQYNDSISQNPFVAQHNLPTEIWRLISSLLGDNNFACLAGVPFCTVLRARFEHGAKIEQYHYVLVHRYHASLGNITVLKTNFSTALATLVRALPFLRKLWIYIQEPLDDMNAVDSLGPVEHLAVIGNARILYCIRAGSFQNALTQSCVQTLFFRDVKFEAFTLNCPKLQKLILGKGCDGVLEHLSVENVTFIDTLYSVVSQASAGLHYPSLKYLQGVTDARFNRLPDCSLLVELELRVFVGRTSVSSFYGEKLHHLRHLKLLWLNIGDDFAESSIALRELKLPPTANVIVLDILLTAITISAEDILSLPGLQGLQIVGFIKINDLENSLAPLKACHFPILGQFEKGVLDSLAAKQLIAYHKGCTTRYGTLLPFDDWAAQQNFCLFPWRRRDIIHREGF